MILFAPHTADENTQSLADNLPNGVVFAAKNITDTNLRKFLTGLAYEITRGESYINQIAEQYDMETTTDFIEDFERALGIPDGCFSVKGKTLDERRKQIVAKIRMNGISTRQQFIDLAALFGFEVEIHGGAYYYVFPLTFPLHFYDGTKKFPLNFPIEFRSNAKEARFTMVVTFKNITSPFLFPLDFPINFSSGVYTIIECLFEKLKPANVVLEFHYNSY